MIIRPYLQSIPLERYVILLWQVGILKLLQIIFFFLHHHIKHITDVGLCVLYVYRYLIYIIVYNKGSMRGPMGTWFKLCRTQDHWGGLWVLDLYCVEHRINEGVYGYLIYNIIKGKKSNGSNSMYMDCKIMDYHLFKFFSSITYKEKEWILMTTILLEITYYYHQLNNKPLKHSLMDPHTTQTNLLINRSAGLLYFQAAEFSIFKNTLYHFLG